MNVFQSTESNVMKHIHDNYAPYSIVVHCMAHCTNLVVQPLSMFPLVKHNENLLKTLHAYFAYFLKKTSKIHKISSDDGNQGEQNLA